MGFTIIEVMIVVTIIGLLAVIAIPMVSKARMRAQDAAFINDLRMLVQVGMEQHAIVRGDFPPDAPPGVQPVGIEDFMPRRIEWDEPTPIGGQWDWDRAPTRSSKVHGCYAGLSVYLPFRTTAQMQKIDAAIDDGDLLTGLFRQRVDGYIYILE